MTKKDHCPKCGAKKSPGYNLCFTCGYRFFGESQQKIVSKDNSHEKMFPPISDLLQSKGSSELVSKCPQCGNEVPEGAKFCFTCGKKVEDQQISPFHQEQKEEKPNRYCPQCGEEYLEGAKFCFTCGRGIEDRQAIPSIEEKVEKEPIRSCPKCGEELLAGAKFCFTCGIKVEEMGSESLGSVIKKEIPEIISRSESQPISSVSEIKKEIPETISPPEPQQIHSVPELRNEETEITTPPEPQFIPPVSETISEIPSVVTTEDLTPIPLTVEIETRKHKLETRFCNFCGMRIPKKTSFCLQCGMIIKNK